MVWKRGEHRGRWIAIILFLIIFVGCWESPEAQLRLRLATTTSTEDSGLLEAIVPGFEELHGVQVDVIAVGTGQALELAARGDADVVLVHAQKLEERFIADGHGTERHEVMYNDFVVVGPHTDPAHIKGLRTGAEAFAQLGRYGALFASRGDNSGTHIKEQSLWAMAGINTERAPWYRSLGQGMGETLIFAEEQQAYTLTDRGTFLAMSSRVPSLAILVGGQSIAENSDPDLRNTYGIIPVNQAKHPEIAFDLATKFVQWILSSETQQKISKYGIERFGQPLFYPIAAPGSE